MLTTQEAAVLAAKKTVELFGYENLKSVDSWVTESDKKHIRSIAKHDRSDHSHLSEAPTVDEANPWKEVTDISVNLETGEITVDTRYNVTIFD